eukprot:jgi/Mesvir1/25467/Mv01732-RA.3
MRLFRPTIFRQTATPPGQDHELHRCAALGKEARATELIEQDATIIKSMDANGLTPLHWAVNGGHMSMVRLLIEKGADVNAAHPKYQNTPLHLAATHDKPDSQTFFGASARPPVDGQMDTVQLLLEKGADVSARNKNGKTPHKMAVDGNFRDIARLIAAWGTPESEATRAPSDELSLPPAKISDCPDMQRVFLRYVPVKQLAADTQDVQLALVKHVTTMEDLRGKIKAVDARMRDLKDQYEKSKKQLEEMVETARKNLKSQKSQGARNDALKTYTKALADLVTEYGKKVQLSGQREEQQKGLEGARQACGFGVKTHSGADVAPPPGFSEEGRKEVMDRVQGAVDEYNADLALAMAATEQAMQQLQDCLEAQHVAAKKIKPRLAEACSAGGSLVAFAFRMLEGETPGADRERAQREQERFQSEAQRMGILVERHKSLRAMELEIKAVRQGLRETRGEANVMRAHLENALNNHEEHEAGRLRNKLEEKDKKRQEQEKKLRDLEAPLTDPDFVKYFPEAVEVCQSAAQPSGQVPSSAQGGRGEDSFDRWDPQIFRSLEPIERKQNVLKAEDHEGNVWVVKKLHQGTEVRREGRRLQALQHKFVIRLERIFSEGDLAYLQMPYCKNGNLRGWFEAIKRKTSQGIALNMYERQQVYVTMRQVFEAVAFIHRKGVVHRDLKPENILLQDDGNIALCDFGVSHDVHGQYQTMQTTLATGHTVAYAAPEVQLRLRDVEKQFPFAQDLWSLGIMLLELETGEPPEYNIVKNRLEVKGQPVDVGKARPSLPMKQDPWMLSLHKLSTSLLQRDPAKRPAVDDVLSNPDSFLARDLAATQEDQQQRVLALSSFLETLRRSSDRSKTHLIKVASRDDKDKLVETLLGEFSKEGNDRLNLLAALAIECDGVRIPLSEAMDKFFQGLVLYKYQGDSNQGSEQPKYGLFEQGVDRDSGLASDQIKEGVTLLPAAGPGDGPDKVKHLKQLRGVGRALAKCVLEALHVPVSFSAAMCCYLVGDELLTHVTDEERLEMLEQFDPVDGRRIRSDLAEAHGDGTAYMLTAGAWMGDGYQDNTFITDSNKEFLFRRATQHRLVGVRQEALEAVRKGFLDLGDLMGDQLRALPGPLMATIFYGQGYVDANKAVSAFSFQDDWQKTASPAKENVPAWLRQFIHQASETVLRLLGLRAFGSIHGLENGRCIVVPGDDRLELPLFERRGGYLRMPINCNEYHIFRSRMESALRVGDYGVRSAAQHSERLRREEYDQIVAAMGTEIKAGGWYRCPNGHEYAIGECGGANQEAKCPACGSPIGGMNHRVAAGNQHALDIDGANRPAWS